MSNVEALQATPDREPYDTQVNDVSYSNSQEAQLCFGQSVPLNLPINSVLQMELDTILLTQDGGCGAATSEWANVRAVSQ